MFLLSFVLCSGAICDWPKHNFILTLKWEKLIVKELMIVPPNILSNLLTCGLSVFMFCQTLIRLDNHFKKLD